MGKIGKMLALYVKIGYNLDMVYDLFYFGLRLVVVASFWIFIWKLIEPRNQLLKILRAGLLVAGFIVFLFITKAVAP